MEADKHTLTGSSQAWYIKDRTVFRIMHSIVMHSLIMPGLLNTIWPNIGSYHHHLE